MWRSQSLSETKAAWKSVCFSSFGRTSGLFQNVSPGTQDLKCFFIFIFFESNDGVKPAAGKKKGCKLYGLRKYNLDYMEIGFMEGGADVEPEVDCLLSRSKSTSFFCFYVYLFFAPFGNGSSTFI